MPSLSLGPPERPPSPKNRASAGTSERWGFGSEQEVRRIVTGYRERGLPLSVLHLDIDHYDAHQV
ncbi:TIM-barrel domain-containing protein, partial [Streptomyces sp. wa22]|uniref:TIM-barrel domain-containing protein n=1 Tax=Streptomyces sp. wa22 TaxID=1828244 RepID=UPI001C9C67C9